MAPKSRLDLVAKSLACIAFAGADGDHAAGRL
jgi:hypothetical protein